MGGGCRKDQDQGGGEELLHGGSFYEGTISLPGIAVTGELAGSEAPIPKRSIRLALRHVERMDGEVEVSARLVELKPVELRKAARHYPANGVDGARVVRLRIEQDHPRIPARARRRLQARIGP